LTQTIKRGEGEIRRFALDGEEEEDEESGDEQDSGIAIQANIAPSSSFFLGGKDDDEDEKSDASDNANEQTSSGKKLKSMFTSSLTGRGAQQNTTSFQNRASRRNPMRNTREQQTTDNQQWRSKGASSFTQRPNQQQEGPLHPSWEAKRKMKEKLELTKGATPQGKKIRFDED